jgi:hypothetical protein
MSKGRLYASEELLKKVFKLPDDCVITNVIHSPLSLTNEFEFIIYSKEPQEGYTYDVDNVGELRRTPINN